MPQFKYFKDVLEGKDNYIKHNYEIINIFKKYIYLRKLYFLVFIKNLLYIIIIIYCLLLLHKYCENIFCSNSKIRNLSYIYGFYFFFKLYILLVIIFSYILFLKYLYLEIKLLLKIIFLLLRLFHI